MATYGWIYFLVCKTSAYLKRPFRRNKRYSYLREIMLASQVRPRPSKIKGSRLPFWSTSSPVLAKEYQQDVRFMCVVRARENMGSAPLFLLSMVHRHSFGLPSFTPAWKILVRVELKNVASSVILKLYSWNNFLQLTDRNRQAIILPTRKSIKIIERLVSFWRQHSIKNHTEACKKLKIT